MFWIWNSFLSVHETAHMQIELYVALILYVNNIIYPHSMLLPLSIILYNAVICTVRLLYFANFIANQYMGITRAGTTHLFICMIMTSLSHDQSSMHFQMLTVRTSTHTHIYIYACLPDRSRKCDISITIYRNRPNIWHILPDRSRKYDISIRVGNVYCPITCTAAGCVGFIQEIWYFAFPLYFLE